MNRNRNRYRNKKSLNTNSNYQPTYQTYSHYVETPFMAVYLPPPPISFKEVIVEKEVVKYKSENDLEECPICTENRAIVSFSCCSILYCSSCAMQIYKDKKNCSQCRKDIDITKVKQLI